MTVALATVGTNFIGLFGLTPLYPEVTHDLHVTADVFGGFVLVQGAISTLIQIPAGSLSDRFGRRPMILIGIAFMVVGQALRWGSTDALVFGAGQLCIGLSSPFAVAPSYALVADAYPGAGRHRPMLEWRPDSCSRDFSFRCSAGGATRLASPC